MKKNQKNPAISKKHGLKTSEIHHISFYSQYAIYLQWYSAVIWYTYSKFHDQDDGLIILRPTLIIHGDPKIISKTAHLNKKLMTPSASPRRFTQVTKVWLKYNEANGGDRRSNITFFPSGKISKVALDAGFVKTPGRSQKPSWRDRSPAFFLKLPSCPSLSPLAALAGLTEATHLASGSEWRPGPLWLFRQGKPCAGRARNC